MAEKTGLVTPALVLNKIITEIMVWINNDIQVSYRDVITYGCLNFNHRWNQGMDKLFYLGPTFTNMV